MAEYIQYFNLKVFKDGTILGSKNTPIGSLSENGYWQVSATIGHKPTRYKLWRAHRLIYTLFVGEIPDGEHADRKLVMSKDRIEHVAK